MADRAQVVGVTGANGLLGSALLRASTPELKFIPLEGDITLPSTLRAWPRVDFVVNAAAKTNVDACEADSARAFAVNAEGAKNVANWCKSQAPTPTLIQISTEMVLRPVNEYGKSKAQGNVFVQASLPERHVILYTSHLFGNSPTKKTFPHWVVEKIAQGKPFDVVSDFYCRPTWVGDVVASLAWIVRENYHGPLVVAGSEYLSKFEHASLIARAWGGNAPSLVRAAAGNWNGTRRESMDLCAEGLPLFTPITPLEISTQLFVDEMKKKMHP